jgi:hypothetical protein
VKRKERKYEPAGVLATITLKLWMPGIMDLRDGMETVQRVLKVQTQAGDHVVLVSGSTQQQYTIVEEPRRKKLGLPQRPEERKP